MQLSPALTNPNPGHLLGVLLDPTISTSFQVEHCLSLVESILKTPTELSPGEQEQLRRYIDQKYPDFTQYAYSSSIAQVQSTVGQCAFIVGKENEGLDFFYRAFEYGDQSSFFKGLDYLMDKELYQRAQHLIVYFWENIKKNPDYQILVSIRMREMIISLMPYIYSLRLDELASEMIEILEGERIESNDPRILQYRRVVRYPEEFDLAMEEILALYKNEGSSLVSRQLIASTRIYLEGQIDYLDKHDVIEPDMLLWLSRDPDEGEEPGDDYSEEEWKKYFFLRCTCTLACLFGDISRLEFMLTFIQNEGNEQMEMLAEITYDMGIIEEDEEEGIYDSELHDNELVCFRLIKFLRILQGTEYLELHAKIYKLIEETDLFLGRATVANHKADTNMRIHALRDKKLAGFYHPIIGEAEVHIDSILRLRVLGIVQRSEDFESPQDAISMAYFALEYRLLRGKFPDIDPSILAHVQEYFPMSDIVRDFFQTYYPTYFPSTAPKISDPS